MIPFVDGTHLIQPKNQGKKRERYFTIFYIPTINNKVPKKKEKKEEEDT